MNGSQYDVAKIGTYSEMYGTYGCTLFVKERLGCNHMGSLKKNGNILEPNPVTISYQCNDMGK